MQIRAFKYVYAWWPNLYTSFRSKEKKKTNITSNFWHSSEFSLRNYHN